MRQYTVYSRCSVNTDSQEKIIKRENSPDQGWTLVSKNMRTHLRKNKATILIKKFLCSQMEIWSQILWLSSPPSFSLSLSVSFCLLFAPFLYDYPLFFLKMGSFSLWVVSSLFAPFILFFFILFLHSTLPSPYFSSPGLSFRLYELLLTGDLELNPQSCAGCVCVASLSFL
jgi:hypothetical protein